jgi:hypothetical protein
MKAPTSVNMEQWLLGIGRAILRAVINIGYFHVSRT